MASKMVEADYRYLSVTEFEGRTVSYGSSFSPIEGEKRAGSVTCSADRENEVSTDICYIPTVCLTGF